MGIEYSTSVDHPIETVFAWHERPGAFVRLAPPWQPARMVEEARSLSDGRAVIRLPGGLRWVAQHSDYDPPHRFVDDLVSLPLPWHHVHSFVRQGEQRTLVTDVVTTPVPERLLRGMFGYRHAQLRDDLRVQADLQRHQPRPQTVAMTGSSGLIGTALSAFLTTAGHRVIHLVRRPARHGDERLWDPMHPDPRMLDDVDGVVHLAGASIAGRFSDAHKRAISESRIEPTRRLAAAIARSGRPGVFVSASAIGYYGSDRGDELLDEGSGRGDGFLAGLVEQWEEGTSPARDAGTRVVTVRTGIALSPRGGMLRLLRPVFAAGLGGPVGNSRQWLSWIDLDDVTDVYARALVDDGVAGPLNAVAPEPVRNREFAATLARVLHRPAVLPAPTAALRVVVGGEGVREVACASQRVRPGALDSLGYTFRRPSLEACLRHQLGRREWQESEPLSS